ncbi:hypothetical protein ACSFA2_23380 [Variovorax sp. LT2P21]|uniref:hypothetical protein n=1 Tax=Variovorax sp. LT2P21 TaxID=3443731 RepID=UPI003F47D763
MSNLTIAFAAGTGGVAPSLIHLAQGFIALNPDVPGVFYFFGVLIFFFLGALVAFFFAETSAKKAFFLGIGLPALVATAQTKGLPKVVAELVPSAHAQAVTQVIKAPPQKKGQTINFKASSDCKGCELWFANSSGEIIAKEISTSSSGSWQPVAVPAGAAAIGVADPKSNFKLVPVPLSADNSSVTLEFDRKYSPLKDLRRGLGDYDIKSYDPSINFAQ